MSLKRKIVISYILISLFIIISLIYATDSYYQSSMHHNSKLVESMQLLHIRIGIISFIVSSIIGIIMANTISKPIEIVSDKTREIKDGHYGKTVSLTTSTSEIQDLITSVNSLSKALENEYHLKKQMVVNYSHEIRTPLTCIISTIEGMADGIIEISEEKLNEIYSELMRLTDMINKLDELVESSNSESKLVKTDFDLVQLTRTIISTFEMSFTEKNIAVDFSSELEVMNIYADIEKIRSLFTNLISNAYKYTNINGKVEINIRDSKDKYLIIVRDNGIGIEEEELEKIFDYLYRVDKSRVKDIEGYGIGLALCKSIVLSHGGDIAVDSKLSEGTTFKITLNKGN